MQSKFSASVRLAEYLSPKKESSNPTNISSFSDDAYSFGKLIEFVLDSCDSEGESIRSLREIAVQLTNEDPAQRTQLSSLLGHPALSNSLIQIIEFCNTIHLKTDDEKDEFFGAIVPRLRSIPADVVARRLCRLLLSRYVLLEARSQAKLYPALLVPAEDGDGILPRSHFQHRMVPEILRLFKVRESAVRTVLLSHFHLYARYIAHERLVGFVTDEVFHGCHDSDNHLVAASLRALAILVEIAGADAVCPWPISKIFANGSPLHEHRISNIVRDDNIKTWSDEEIADWNNDPSWSADWKADDKPSYELESEAATQSCEPESEAVTQSPSPVKFPTSTLNTSSTLVSKKSIGSEFEISVSTQRSLEDDLLADLTPNITTTSLIEQLSSLQNTVNAISAAKKVPLKFAMVETAEEAEGWEENVDENLTSIEDVGMKEVK
ncbi:Protein kinase domain-containing protein [Trichostrongylus colubriformis]|uniref:Protein kinase domain-containing protein n=1 Tax=Trichostrongylus colubriformis TaxID=6319 RepID=A0AAN8IN97_TRICO